MRAVRVEPCPLNELLLFSPATIAEKWLKPDDTRTTIVTTPGGNGNEGQTDGFDGPHPETAFGDTMVVRAFAAGAATASTAIPITAASVPRAAKRREELISP